MSQETRVGRDRRAVEGTGVCRVVYACEEGLRAMASEEDCLFCGIVAGEVDAYVVLATDEMVGFLDIRPVFKGHVLLVPRLHVETLADLPARLRDPFLEAAQRITRAVTGALGAQGSFVAVNNTVSQSVPHLHLHVVPRTKGDGLRGFFWPRMKYADAAEMADYATRLGGELESAG